MYSMQPRAWHRKSSINLNDRSDRNYAEAQAPSGIPRVPRDYSAPCWNLCQPWGKRAWITGVGEPSHCCTGAQASASGLSGWGLYTSLKHADIQPSFCPTAIPNSSQPRAHRRPPPDQSSKDGARGRERDRERKPEERAELGRAEDSGVPGGQEILLG